MSALTIAESNRLALCEECIQKGLKAFYEVGQALREVRDQRLYRGSWDSFEAYCADRWKMGRAHAYRLMESSEVIENLSPIGDELPANEAQTRPLTRLEPKEQGQAWQAAQAIAANHEPTALHVARAADAVKGKPVAFEPGTVATVLDEDSALYGQPVTVQSCTGVIVRATTADGSEAAFLSNELSSDRPTPTPQADDNRPAKPSPIATIEARLAISAARVELLEEKLEEAIALLEQYASGANLDAWVSKARSLLS